MKYKGLNDYTKEDLMFIIEREWQDVHHTRNQNWTVIAFLGVMHFSVFQYQDEITELLGIDNCWCYFTTLFITILAVFVHIRHHHICKHKMNWITKSEKELGYIDDCLDGEIIHPKILKRTNWFSINYLTYGFDLVFIVANIVGLMNLFL